MPAIDTVRTLTDHEIASYASDGFVVVDGIFSDDETEALRVIVDANPGLSHYRRSAGTVNHVGITDLDPAFLALARDPRLVALLAPLIGPDIILMHSKLASKPLIVDAGPVVWHQDGAFFPHTNCDVPTLMVMLDDATPENGCLHVARGSHRLGYLDHHDEDGWFCGECRDRVWERDPASVVPMTPRRGDVSIHHPLTLHSSPANRSGRQRRGLAFACRAADAMQLGDVVWSDSGLVVSGAHRGRVRCDPQPIILPRFPAEMGRGERGSAWNQVGAFARACNRAVGLSEIGELVP